MKKLVYILAVLLGLSMVSCVAPESNEELSELENLEVLATEQGDSTNTGGGGNEELDNDEG